MAKGRFVSYLRVSTRKQGDSGLGLEAQRAAVDAHLNGGKWELLAEFQEIESGKRNDRPKLSQAIKLCRRKKATLVIARLDRLARNVAFTASLMDSGVKFVACDMPEANKLTIHILAAVAEAEAEAISKRTIAALQAAKERGTVLGGRRVSAARFAEIREAGREASKKRAGGFVQFMLPTIREIQGDGNPTLREIAQELNERGIDAPRGGEWSPTQVSRVLARSKS